MRLAFCGDNRILCESLAAATKHRAPPSSVADTAGGPLMRSRRPCLGGR
jgi:hypothetical protein